MRLVISIPSDDDTKISLLFGVLLAYNEVSWALNAFVNKYISAGAWWDSAIVLGIVLVAIIFAAQAILNRQNYKTVFVYLFFLFAFGIVLMLELPGADEVKKSSVTFFFTILSYFLVGSAISECNLLRLVIIKAAKISNVAALIWLLLYLSDSSNSWSDSMSMAYCLLPSVCILIYSYFSDRNTLNLLWMIIPVAILVLMGTRGPIFISILYIVCMIIYFSHSYYKFVVVILLSIVGIVFYIYYRPILIFLSNVFSVKGVTNAAFYKMLNAEDVTNGRTVLYSTVWKQFLQNPILGNGVFSEWPLIGGYAHLLPLQLLVHFGIVLGVPIIVYLVINIIKFLIEIKEDTFRFCFVLAIISVGIMKLMFSGSYLIEPYFYLLLGMLSNRQQLEKINNEEIY